MALECQRFSVCGQLLGMDAEVGSIEPGKLADLILIDRDLFQIDPQTISDVRVLLTMVGGREVYRAPDFTTP